MCVWLCAKIKMAKLSFCLVSCVSLIESPHLNTGKFTLKETIHRTPSQHHCHCHPFILILLSFASTMNTAEHRTRQPGQPSPRCAGEASPRGASRRGRWRSRRATRGSRCQQASSTRGTRAMATMAKKSIGDLTEADLEGKRVCGRLELHRRHHRRRRRGRRRRRLDV